jgi:hypothetical protein
LALPTPGAPIPVLFNVMSWSCRNI